jgi:anti-sigma factor RsiW
VIGHLGTRASALLDGQLPPAEAERLWEHVHGCHLCRDLVEREGWIKTQLSGLGAPAQAPDHLKGALLGACSRSPLPPASAFAEVPARSRARTLAMVGVGVGSAAGMAVMGVLALGASPADAPAGDPQAPIANLTPPTDGGSTLLPVRDRRP